MQAKSEALGFQGLKWEVADMLALPYEQSTFDVVLEKGTMDVLFVDNDSPWQPKPDVCMRVHQLLMGIHRSAFATYSTDKTPCMSFKFDCDNEIRLASPSKI